MTDDTIAGTEKGYQLHQAQLRAMDAGWRQSVERERINGGRMRKIPTLFVRDPDDMRHLTREVHPDCQWVIDGEGVPTRKYDGTAVMFDGTDWWTRREVRADKVPPHGFAPVETDAATDKTVGWEPAEQSAWWKYLREAIGSLTDSPSAQPIPWEPGTYELVGPKINRNPEGSTWHQLVRHARAKVLTKVPRDYDGLAAFLADFPHEGIVWHHPDGRMAKIKRRDFRTVENGQEDG